METPGTTPADPGQEAMRNYSSLPALVLALFTPLTLASCGGGSPSSSSAKPVFLSTPPTAADEGSAYSYAVQASDPANGTVSYHLTVGPAGSAISGETITWIPTGAQSRQANSFSVTATTAAGGSAVQSWSVTPSGVVHVTWVRDNVSDDATSSTPLDMTHDTLAALIPNSTGGFDRLNGQGLSNGTGTVAHVPAGSFWFDLDENTFIWTSASNLDLSNAGVPGRPDVGDLTPNFSTLDFSISGLNPWQATDQLQWHVTNAGFGGDSFPFGPFPPTGATTFAPSLANFFTQFDASKGDQQVLAQLVTHSVSAWTVLTLDRVFGPVPISISGGAVIPISAPLSDPPRSSVRANFGGSGFQALVPTMNPSAVAGGTGIELRVEPGPTPHEPLFWGPELAIFSTFNPLSSTAITSDLDLGDVSYGNPFVSTWPVFLHYLNGARVSYAPPGLPAGQMGANAEIFTTTLPTASSPLQPLVGPPINASINGVDFFHDQTGVGLTPTLTWNPPTVGSASGYELAFCYFGATPGGGILFLSETCVGVLFTKITSVTVPPGLLESGKYYFVTLRSISQPGLDIATAPFKTAFPRATADALSGIISP
jgi:hypothetical protein